ncbi:hypothetical protein [Cellulomonas sp. NPDC089187]
MSSRDAEAARTLPERAPSTVPAWVEESTADRAVIALRNNGAIVSRRAA